MELEVECAVECDDAISRSLTVLSDEGQPNRDIALKSALEYLPGSTEQLDLVDDGVFDVVLTRHAPTFAPEIDRVTKPGGLFICQGVGARNMANIRQAFNAGSTARHEDDHQSLLSELTARGWRVVAEGHYDVRYWVKDVPSLVFWFQAIAGANPIPEHFSIATHYGVINALIRQFGLTARSGDKRTPDARRRAEAQHFEGRKAISVGSKVIWAIPLEKRSLEILPCRLGSDSNSIYAHIWSCQ